VSDFVDTNVFIRLLTNDDQKKFERCLDLFERAEQGHERLVTSESVVAEIVYVLSSQISRVARPQIAQALRPVLENRGLTIEHKQAVLAALDLYESSTLDFEDCLSVAHVNRLALDSIISYDRDFDRVAKVRRREP
jgi:predicted nucleic acid-binding protein